MVILSETSQCGGNMAPNLSSHCKRCFLNQVYRRSILSSHPLSSESLNRKRYSFSCTPTNHFKSSCLKNLKSWKYLVTKITVTTIKVFNKKTTQNLNLSKLPSTWQRTSFSSNSPQYRLVLKKSWQNGSLLKLLKARLFISDRT